jgi:hypothetical protein
MEAQTLANQLENAKHEMEMKITVQGLVFRFRV